MERTLYFTPYFSLNNYNFYLFIIYFISFSYINILQTKGKATIPNNIPI